jgi:hypothetical protein
MLLVGVEMVRRPVLARPGFVACRRRPRARKFESFGYFALNRT